MSENTFRIIEAADTPMGIGSGDLALTIAWPDGSETVEHVSERAAAALGYQRPEEPAAPPAWVVEMAREGVAQTNERRGSVCDHGFARSVRAGTKDDHPEVKAAIAALRLALERGHVVEARLVPSEEPLVKALERIADYGTVSGMHDQDRAPKLKGIAEAALQARRNMPKEGAVGGSTKASAVDLEQSHKRAWDNGYSTAICALQNLADGEGNATTLYANEREKDVLSILSTLPTREA